MKALMKKLHGCLRSNLVMRPRLSPNFTLLTLLSQDHGLLNLFCSHSIPKSFPLYSMSQPLLYPKSPTICFSYLRYPKKILCFLCFIFLYISFYLFHSVLNRDIPKLGTSHLSFLILILSTLSSHFVRFA